MDLTGKAALVTGGGTGLGREISLQLAREGMRVAIGYSRSQSDAEETAAIIQSEGGTAITICADLSTTKEYAEIFRTVEAGLGRLDLLVLNAATTHFIPFDNLDAVTEEVWDEVFALNTRSAFFLSKAAAPLLKRDGGGQIITTSSIAGLSPIGSSIPYAVSKAALIHVTKCLATALAPDVRVNCVAPGLLMTRWVQGFPDERLEQMQQAALLRRDAGIEDTAAAFIMLASNSSMTGQVVVVDAGQLR